jgi:hypothetical protein
VARFQAIATDKKFGRQSVTRLLSVLIVAPTQRNPMRSSKQPPKAKEPLRRISGSPRRVSPPGDMPSVAPAERHIETPVSAKGVEIFPAGKRSEKMPRR